MVVAAEGGKTVQMKTAAGALITVGLALSAAGWSPEALWHLSIEDLLAGAAAGGALAQGLRPWLTARSLESLLTGLQWVSDRVAPYVGPVPLWSLPLIVVGLVGLVAVLG